MSTYVSLSQCSKLLSDTSVIQFYPSKFVLITDILDTFGEIQTCCHLAQVVLMNNTTHSVNNYIKGGLVYDRIWTMCSDPRPLPGKSETCPSWRKQRWFLCRWLLLICFVLSSFYLESFTVDDVSDTAKETCLNWFFKIASIRELLPRLYPLPTSDRTVLWLGLAHDLRSRKLISGLCLLFKSLLCFDIN